MQASSLCPLASSLYPLAGASFLETGAEEAAEQIDIIFQLPLVPLPLHL